MDPEPSQLKCLKLLNYSAGKIGWNEGAADARIPLLGAQSPMGLVHYDAKTIRLLAPLHSIKYIEFDGVVARLVRDKATDRRGVRG